MLTLYLLRHAKSSWDQPAVSDFDRPLARRGREAAPRMGRYMENAGFMPGLVLCSPAARARQTMELVLDILNCDPEVRLVDGLYSFGAGTDLLRIIQDHGASSPQLMVIGHNPSLEDLALGLAGTGRDDDLEDMARKYPTAALAVLEFDAGTWSDIGPSGGRLLAFTRPRTLR